MMQRREDESVTAFTMRRLTCDIVCTELEELARDFEADPDQRWTGSQIGDYLRDRAANHPSFTNGESK